MKEIFRSLKLINIYVEAEEPFSSFTYFSVFEKREKIFYLLPVKHRQGQKERREFLNNKILGYYEDLY